MKENGLIYQAKNGDRTAFNSLIQAHRDIMFRYAFLIVYDAHIAEDVTQEAVLRIYKHLDGFDENYAFRPWALQITRNIARNHNRSWGRYKNMLMRFMSFQYNENSDIESLSLAQQAAKQLHEAVQKLSVDHQDVIYARFFLEMSVEESAKILDIAEGTVKSRSHRALNQLKTVIDEQYPQLKPEASDE